MANYSPLWDAYSALMACCLVALDKRPGVRLVGIGETLRRALSKLVMKAARDQAKTSCGSIQLCASLEPYIDRGACLIIENIQKCFLLILIFQILSFRYIDELQKIWEIKAV